MKDEKTNQNKENELKKKEVTLISKGPKENYLSSVSEGMCFPPHQAKMIWQGNKTLIVGPNLSPLIGKLLYVIGGNECYGIISLKNSNKINLKEFLKLEEKHRVSSIERKLRWANMLDFEACEFKLVKKFDLVKRVPSFEGKTYVERVEFLEEKKLVHFKNPKEVENFLSSIGSTEVISYLSNPKDFINKVRSLLELEQKLLTDNDFILFEGISPMIALKKFSKEDEFANFLFGV